MITNYMQISRYVYFHNTGPNGNKKNDIRTSVSCVIHPLPVGKVRQRYIARILGLLYFLRFNTHSLTKCKIPTKSCSSVLNSSGQRHGLADDVVAITS